MDETNSAKSFFTCMVDVKRPGLYFIKVKNILSLKFKNNLIFHFIKELRKIDFLIPLLSR